MNKEQVKGRIEEAKGNVKEAAGAILGDKSMEVAGSIQRHVGRARASLADIKEEINSAN